MSKTSPKEPPKPCRDLPKTPKIEVGSVHERHDAPKSTPRASKRYPRNAQEASKSGRQAPKSTQKTAKTHPKESPNPPKSCPASLKAALARDLRNKPCSKDPQIDFRVVLDSVRRMADMRFVLVFTVRNACRAFFAIPVGKQWKTMKNLGLEPPKPSPGPPETLQNRARSVSGRTKTGQEWQRNAARAAKRAQEVHKTRPRAKTVPKRVRGNGFTPPPWVV